MPQNLKVGDVVRLKSGGAIMTVSEITDEGVWCQWFDGSEAKRALFPPAALEDPHQPRQQP